MLIQIRITAQIVWHINKVKGDSVSLTSSIQRLCKTGRCPAAFHWLPIFRFMSVQPVASYLTSLQRKFRDMADNAQWWVAGVLQEAVYYAQKFGLDPVPTTDVPANGTPPQPRPVVDMHDKAKFQSARSPRLWINCPNFFHPAEEKTTDSSRQKL